MKTTTILEISKKPKEQEYLINGWIKTNRPGKAVGFINFKDGTHFDGIQVVYKPDVIKNFEEISKLNTSASIQVKGILKLTPGQKQPYELISNEIRLLKNVADNFPIQNKDTSFEFLREVAHLRPKTNTFEAVFRVRSKVAFYIHEFFNKNNYIWVASPILTGNDAEGAGESFTVTTRSDSQYDQDFFGKKASLTVSGQLNAEAYAQSFQKVYTFGPTFRAENSNTSRHAAEFWMIEPEVAFADLKDNMKLIESLIKYVIKKYLAECKNELAFFEKTLNPELGKILSGLVKSKFKRMTYTQAIKILKEAVASGHKFENNQIKWGMDLASEHERYICEKFVKGPVFLTNYPKDIKAFYMKQDANNKTVSACDLLAPGIGEIVGGSQREDDYDKLMRRCKEMNIPTHELEWYIGLRNFGYHKSAGFGLGFERLLMYLTGMENIRDVIPFPRTPRNLEY